MSSVWDDPTLRSNDNYVSFDAVGDTLVADVIAVTVHQFDDGKRVPKLIVTTDDGEERTLTAGQVRLKNLLAEKRPEAGDRIKIVLTEIEKRSGGKTLKHFTVDVKKGGGTATARPAVIIEDEEPF